MKITVHVECEECGKVTEAVLNLPEGEVRGTCCPVGPQGERGPTGVADDKWLGENDETRECGGV